MLGTLTNHINFFCLLRFNLTELSLDLTLASVELNPLEAPRSSECVWAAAVVTKIFLPRGHCVPSELFHWEKLCWKFLGSWCFCLAGCHVIHLPSVFCHCHYPLYVRCRRTEVQIKVVSVYILGAEVQKNHFSCPGGISLEEFLSLIS